MGFLCGEGCDPHAVLFLERAFHSADLTFGGRGELGSPKLLYPYSRTGEERSPEKPRGSQGRVFAGGECGQG